MQPVYSATGCGRGYWPAVVLAIAQLLGPLIAPTKLSQDEITRAQCGVTKDSNLHVCRSVAVDVNADKV